MTTGGLDALLGLPLAEARGRLAVPPVVQRAEPPRPKHPFPPDDAWRVVRAAMGPDGPVLVVAPPIQAPPSCS